MFRPTGPRNTPFRDRAGGKTDATTLPDYRPRTQSAKDRNEITTEKSERMKDFEKLIWRDALTLVDFYASWCGSCRQMQPVIEKFRVQMNGRADVFQINIDSAEDAETVLRYGIDSVPTLIFFRRGEILWRQSGRITYEQLHKVLETLEKKEHVMDH